MIEKHDTETIRCPALGDEVNFKYCRIMNDRFPCSRIVACWQTRLDINKFLLDNFTNEELDRIFVAPQSKMQKLVSLVEKSKKIKAGK